jgi:branched-chain amino acid transport system permease protein
LTAQDVQQIVVSGVSNGAIYGLVALGYAVGFAATRVINFALGDLMMVSAMVSVTLAGGGVPLGLAIVIGLLCAVAVSVATYLGAVKPVVQRDPGGFTWLVTTLGVSIVLEASAALAWGSTSRAYPALLSSTSFSVNGTVVPYQDVLDVGLVVGVVVLLDLLRRRSLLGRAAAASAADPEMASALGISRNVVAVAGFGLAGLLAGTAGILVAPLVFANAYMGVGFGLKGFVAMMVGGIGRPAGAIVGALVLGLSEAFAINRLGSGASDWFPFALLIAVLICRPHGLIGSREAAVVQ